MSRASQDKGKEHSKMATKLRNQKSENHYDVELSNPSVEKEPRSWKIGVKGKLDTDWVYNELRFQRRLDAEHYGLTLMRRWLAIQHYAVHPSNDEPNATFPVPNVTYPIKSR